MSGELLSATALRDGAVLRTDVVVIGSGAGGATFAARVAEAGREVTVLEAGPAVRTEDFSANPHEMAVKLYADSALAATVGFPAIPVYYGRCLGGSTTINSGTCFRTPDKVFAKWRRAGLAGFSDEALDGWYREVERDLHIAAPPLSLIGRNAGVMHDVRQSLGLSGGVIKRNASGCRASGLCCFGCPTGGKQSMLVSAIPRAIRAGARVLADCRVDRIVRKGARVVAVEATVQDGDAARPLLIEADQFVLSGGAMMSPGLLRRSGLGSPALGRHLTLHPALKVAAIMAEEIRPVDGVPQSYYIDEWHEDGFLIETIAVPPTIEALSLPFAGPRHAALMERVEHMLSWGAMISDTSEGRIRFLPGKDLPTYSLNSRDARVAKAAIIRLAWLAFEAGAERVLTTTYGASEFRSVDDLRRFARKPIKPSDLDLTAFHPLGTCRMGIDPARSVVDRDHRVHGLDNLRVVDGSVFPSSLSVNPQWTIMAFALRAADRLLGR